MSEDAQQLNEAKKLPWPDRIAHPNWKVRGAAFDDINVACNGVYDPSDPCLQEFAPLFPKAVLDANAAAQDKALDALAAFQAKATEQHVAKSADKTCSNIINKALAGRITTVQRAVVVLLNYVELEQGPVVAENLIAGFKHKVPKVAVACIDVLVQAVSLFGTKAIDPKPVLKALPPLFDTKDGKARDKAKELVVELSRWVGPDIVRTSLFKEMRDATKEDIERAMQEVANLGRPQPERLTRKEQARLAALRAQQEATPASEQAPEQQDEAKPEAAAVQEEPPPEMDPYDFADPKDITKELKKDFWEGLESKKWSDRKGSLARLRELCSHPKLASGRDVDYGDLNRELRKIITKDNNVAVVAEAIHCTGAMAKGLRSAYSGTAKGLVDVLLEKFKEKNPAVGRAANESLTIMHKYCFSLLDVAETLAGGLGHANPKVKEETLGWMRSAVCEEPKPTLSKLAPLLLGPASKCAEEATPSLREAALAFMVAFAIQFGNRAVLGKYTGKMDDTRQKRLDEMLAEAQAAVSGGAGGGGAGAAASPAPAAAAAAAATTAAAMPARGPSAAAAALAASKSAKPGVRGGRPATAPTTSAASSSASRPGTSAGASKGKTGGTGAKKAGGAGAAKEAEVEDEATVASQTLSKDEAVTRLTELFGEKVVKGLQDEQWKSRLDNMEVIVARVQEGSMGEHCSTLVQAMAHLPGWGEKNFQVMAKQFEVIRLMASTVPTFSRRDAYAAILGLVEKVSDMKLKGPSFETLSIIAEAVGPQFVSNMLHKRAAGHKNPKILSEVLNWIGQAISDFGLNCFNVKMLLDYSKEDLASANAGVRNSAIHVLGVMHRFLGSPLADMIRSDVKPALMAAIEGECAKNPKDGAFTPTRVSKADEAKRAATGAKGGTPGPKGKAGAAPEGAEADAGDAGGGGYDAAEDLLPRADISASITPTLISNLGSANWKERKQGLDDVEALLISSGGRIQPQLGDLVGALKGRMSDSNKNLMAQALVLTGKLARAAGKSIDRSARPLLGPALRNLSDNKASVRGAVVEMMESWASVAGMDTITSELLEVLQSPKCTGDGKADGIGWLAKRAAAGQVPSSLLPQCLHAVAIGAVDKTGEVRGAATELVSGLLQGHSPSALSSAANSLDGAQKKVVLEQLTKVTGGPVPTATAAAPASRPQTAAPTTRASTARPMSAAAAGRSTSASSRPATANSTSRLNLNKGGTASAAAAALAQEEGPLLVLDNKKEERARKGKFRPGKLEVRNEEPAVLESEFGPLMSGSFRSLMFSKDFKQQCQAVDMLRDSLPGMFDEVLSQLDLLFRWCTLRIMEANTQMLVKVLDLLKEIFSMMAERGVKMSEYDCRMIMPVLVEKAGHNQDKIKADHRELLRQASEVQPPTRIASYIKDGLESKNNKTRVVCADELATLIERNGPLLYRPSGPKAAAQDNLLLSISKLVGERDQSLRSAALSGIEAVYKIEGPQGLWQMLEGKVPNSSKTLIEERLKYTDKQLTRAGLYPGYRAAEFGEGGEDQMDGQSAAYNLRASATSAASPRPGTAPSPMRGSQSAIGAGARASQQVPPLGLRGQANANGSILAQPRSGIPNPFASSGPELAATAAAHGSGIGMGRTPRDSSGTDYFHAAGGSSISGGVPPTISNVEANNLSNSTTMAYLRQGTGSVVGGPTAASTAGVSPLQALSRQDEGEMERDFHRCLQRLAEGDIEEAVQVMKLFCYELMDQGSNGAPVVALFQANMDQVISILTMRSDEIFASACEAAARQEAGNSRACKYALNTLMNIFQSPSLGQVISKDTLRPLMSVLLCCLVDEMVGLLPEGMAMLKALNLLMMKILENSDRTAVFAALMDLLLQPHHRLAYTPNAAKAEQGWYDLVVKCMIKITKNLPATVDHINIQAVLLSVHTFFDTLGGEEIRKRGAREDKPLRMVKTVLHELCKLKGASIYNYTRDIPGADLDPALKPIIFPYIDLNLQTLAPEFMRSGTSAPPSAVPYQQPQARTSPPAPSSRPPSQPQEAAVNNLRPPSTSAAARPSSSSSLAGDAADAHRSEAAPAAQQPVQAAQPAACLAASADIYCQRVADDPAARVLLSAIFKRIAENSADRHQALVDLYFFTTANPGQDIEAMLAAASPTFKNFIVRGLHKVRQQAQWQAQQAQLHQGAPPDSSAQPSQQQPLTSAAAAAAAVGVSTSTANSQSTTPPPEESSQQHTAAASSSVHSRPGSGIANAPGSGASPAERPQGYPARIAVAASDSGSAGGALSPASPSGTVKGPRAAPVVGEDKIAELKDRMHRMQLDMQSMPARSASGPTMAAIAACANAPSASPTAASAGGAAGASGSTSPSPLSNPNYTQQQQQQQQQQQRGVGEGGFGGSGVNGDAGGGGKQHQLSGDGSGGSSMATLQERMRRLRELEGQ